MNPPPGHKAEPKDELRSDGQALLPAGQYRCRVKAATESQTKKGVGRWSLRFEIVEGEQKGREIRDDLYWSTKALPRAKRFLDAIGVEIPKGEAEIKLSLVRCRELVVDVELEERDGLERNKVSWHGYFAPPPPPRPEILRPEPSGIPDELKARTRWVCWKLEVRRNSKGEWKWTKLPLRARDGESASTTSPSDWDSFEAAWARYLANTVDGIGFVFVEEDRIVGVDLDHALEGEALAPWAEEITKKLSSFTERSVRGEGVHIFGRGTLPPGRRKSGPIEVYNVGRFFVVTGVPLNGFPREIAEFPPAALEWLLALMERSDRAEAEEPSPGARANPHGTNARSRLSDNEIIEKATSAKNGTKFRELWVGGDAGHPSPSEGDLALCCLLAFWTGPDAGRIDALFRQSGRMREKWDEFHGQETYGATTIRKALESCRTFYQPHESRSSRQSSPESASPLSNPPEPYEPFPVEVLPRTLREFVAASAEALGCDSAFVILPVLAAVAGVIGNSRRVRIKRSWEEPAILWTAIVAESGTLKSPALDKAVSPIQEIQRDKDREHQEDLKEFEKAQLRYEHELKEWKKRGQGDPPEKPEPPVHQRVLISDPTAEAAALILKENPRGVLLSRDELAGWLGAFDSYKTGQADGPFWLQAHRGAYHVIDRKTGIRCIAIPHTTVSICGCFQPKALGRALGSAYFENGLAARFLFAGPPRRTKLWTDATISPEMMASYRSCLARLSGLSMKEDADGELEPVVLELTAEAREVFIRFYNEFAEAQAAASGDVASAFAKLEGYVPRLALIFELAEWAGNDPDGDPPGNVGRESIEHAVTAVEWFIHEIPRVYTLLREDETDTRCREQLEFIRTRGGLITAREIQRSGSKLFGETAEGIEAALEALVTKNLGTWEVVGPGAEGGRPSRRFRLLESTESDKTPESPDESEVSSGRAAESSATPKGREPGDEDPPEGAQGEPVDPDRSHRKPPQPDGTPVKPEGNEVVSGVGLEREPGDEDPEQAQSDPEEEVTWTA